jgi:hypothetical protein
MAEYNVPTNEAKVLKGDPREDQPEDPNKKPKTADEELVAWVTGRVAQWKEWRDANYSQQWNIYERLWRAIYSEEEKTRKTERSRIISPALSEAVENAAAEIEEAVFGRGDFFTVMPEAEDNPIERAALAKNESRFREDLTRTKFTNACSEAVINSAVYGTGLGEIVQKEIKDVDVKVDLDEAGKPSLRAVETTSERPHLVSVNPRNFIIDPAARDIDSALGCAIEEDVCAYDIRAAINKKQYKDVPIEAAAGDPETKADPQMETPWMFDVVHVIRYYGKVPRSLLFPPEKTESLFDDQPAESLEPVDADMVEARIIIANDQHLLKAIENPDMMGDRPLVAFRWDIVPGRFWGRGVCEKGATVQKLLDAELRSRMDALAYVAAPMMGIDATKLPRGFKFEVYPGKNLLLSGDPNQVLKPFKFGELDQNSAPQVQMLDNMVQRATGSIDGTSLARQGASGEARSGAVSMALAPIVKRNKRTLMRFIDSFLSPAMRKLLWRSMQYDRERYVPINMSFNVASTMGIMQREYETMSLTQMLGVTKQDTTEHMMILMALVNNSGMNNRDQVMAALNRKLEKIQQLEATPPPDPNAPSMDPVVLSLQRIDAQLELATKQAKLAETQAKTRLLNAQAVTESMQPELEAQKVALKGIYRTPSEEIDAEFDRRIKMANVMLKDKEINVKSEIADKQIIAAQANEPKSEPAPKPEPQPVPVPVPVPVVPVV